MITQWLVFMALKAAASFFFFHTGGQIMHSGGPIRAHSGLAVDEVPIIAQTGEGILSRRGMATLGGVGNLNALNSGRGGVGTIINIDFNNAVVREETDFAKIAEAVSQILNAEIERL
jgi:hypothetical protein